jgi:hypothetical protein
LTLLEVKPAQQLARLVQLGRLEARQGPLELLVTLAQRELEQLAQLG